MIDCTIFFSLANCAHNLLHSWLTYHFHFNKKKTASCMDNCTMSFWLIETQRGSRKWEDWEQTSRAIQPLSNYVCMMPQEKDSLYFIYFLPITKHVKAKHFDVFWFHKVKQDCRGAKIWVNHWLHLLHSSVSMQNVVMTTQIQKHHVQSVLKTFRRLHCVEL